MCDYTQVFALTCTTEWSIRNPILRAIAALAPTHSFLPMNWTSIICNLIPNAIYMQISANYTLPWPWGSSTYWLLIIFLSFCHHESANIYSAMTIGSLAQLGQETSPKPPRKHFFSQPASCLLLLNLVIKACIFLRAYISMQILTSMWVKPGRIRQS